MTSEIRANTLKNRVGLGTISFTNTGPIVSGIVTANGADINGDIDVDGHTNLDNVSIAGVSTVGTFLQVLGQGGTSDKGFEVRSNSTQNTDTNQAIRVRNNSNTDTFKVSYKGKVEATSFHGDGSNLTTVTATRVTATDQSSDTTCFPLFVQATTGDLTPHTGTNLAFNSATGQLIATSYIGNGAGLSYLNASTLASGTVPIARLGSSGTKSGSTFLAGDNTFKTITGTTINNNADNRIITGSGTANTLEGEANLTFDGSKLGVGTNNPTAKLEIKGSDNPLVKIVQDTSGIARLNLESATNDGYQYSGIGLGDGTNDAELMWTTLGFDINVGNAVRLRMKSDGSVNILGPKLKLPTGTSNPGSSVTGDSYYNTSDGTFKIYDGSVWGSVVVAAKGTQQNPAANSTELAATGALAQYYFKPNTGDTAFQQYACGGLSNLGTIPSGGPSWVTSHSSLIIIEKGQLGTTTTMKMSQANYGKFIKESITRNSGTTPYVYWAVFDGGTLWGIWRIRWTGATYSTWISNHNYTEGSNTAPSGSPSSDVWKTGSGTTGNALATGTYTISNNTNLNRAVLPEQDYNSGGFYGIHYKRLNTGEHYPWRDSSGNYTSNGYFQPSTSYSMGSDSRYVHYVYLADN